MNEYEKAVEYLKDQRSKLHIAHEGCVLSKETIVDHAKKREMFNFIIGCVIYCAELEKTQKGIDINANIE